MSTHARVLRAPCSDPQRAADAANHLRAQHVDVIGTDGRHVLIPAGWSPVFVWDLAEALGEYGHDDELATWAASAASARSDDDPGAIRNQPGYAPEPQSGNPA